MAKIPKTPISSTRLNTILMVMGFVITITTIISTVATIIVHTSNTQTTTPNDPTISETSASYRGLEEFADNDSRLAYAADLLDQNLYQAAEAFLSEFLVTVEPDSRLSIAIRYDRGLAYLYLGEYDQAISDFSIVTAQVDYSDAYYNLGNALVGLKKYEKALEAYESALKLEQKPEYIEVRDTVLDLLS